MAYSEVAQMRQCIEWECEALQRMLSGFAMVASHDMIQHKYRRLGAYQEQLGALVGEQEAIKVVCETYNKVMR